MDHKAVFACAPTDAKLQCVVLNLLTDVNNCGAQNFKCPSSYFQGSGVSCVAGLCLTTCLGLFDCECSRRTRASLG